MKVAICDVCFWENKVGLGKYRLRLKSSGISLAIDLCEKHKDYGKAQTPEETMDKYTELTHTPKPILRTDLLFEQNFK